MMSLSAKAARLASSSGGHWVQRNQHMHKMAIASHQTRGFRVLAIGNTIIDTVLTMPSIPADDKVWIDSKKKFVGGQGMNCAQDMALLGIDVSILTRVGDDDD